MSNTPEEKENPWVTFETRCTRCGKTITVTTLKTALSLFEKQGKKYSAKCRDCDDLEDMEKEQKEEQEHYSEEATLDEAVISAGVRPAYAVRKPIIPYVADWLLAHRGENILLTGETGTGKSTSAGYLVRELIRDHHTVGMYYLSELFDEWRKVRCDHDDPFAIKAFFLRLQKNEYCIIDECAGKTVNSDSSREMMFRFLEDINSGACRSKVILLGNFFKGSIADTFGDEAPSMRRIRENFTCGRIVPSRKTITPIFGEVKK